jgi:putative endonuclease
VSRAGGDAAEELAARHLEANGYRIVARNVRSKLGELDIVARDGRVVCFVEVRARRDGTAAESVDAGKRRRLARAAGRYLTAQHLSDAPCRFDVVTVGPAGVAILKDAFVVGSW